MIYPLFYPRFHCLAASCSHTCCSGWEICVDAASERKYRSLPGALGEELRKNLIVNAEGAEFRLTPDGDCPFLTAQGLCRLIEAGGEALLCDICAAHPRFYGDVNGREYCGLGLSCEAAVRLLLSPGPLRFADGQAGRVFSFDSLCAFVGLRLTPAETGFSPETDENRLREWFGRLRGCEPIDDRWQPSVDCAVAALSDHLRTAPVYLRANRSALNKIYQYILYRRLEDARTYTATVCARFSRFSASYILLEAIRTGDLNESVRRWSEEIEYSDENVKRLLSALC